MTIGTKVRRKTNDFLFDGTVIGEVITSNGRRFLAVEQTGTGMVMCFYENMLFEDDGFGWSDPHGIAIAPPLKQTLPFHTFVPIRAVPHQGANRAKFMDTVRTTHLKRSLWETLVTDRIRAEITFHFKGLHSGDLDNLLKPTIDLLKHSVIRDDNQIVELAASFRENMPQDGIDIKLSLYEPPQG